MEERPEVWPAERREYYRHHLLQQERAPLAPTDPRERKLCTTWIVRACSDYGFRPNVAGLAIHFFDLYLSAARGREPSLRGASETRLTFKELILKTAGEATKGADHKESQICELMCICCITVAAKKLEPKEKAPYLGDFDENFAFSELRGMERLVLEALQWRLTYATGWDFTAFWTPFTERSVDKGQFKALCDEALGRCVKEEGFAAMRASVFGAATTLWAHAALGEATESWEQTLLENAGLHMDEDLLVALDKVGEVMKKEYPQAYTPYRSGSPTNVTDMVERGFFSGEVGPKSGLKRPSAERWEPDSSAKYAKCDEAGSRGAVYGPAAVAVVAAAQQGEASA